MCKDRVVLLEFNKPSPRTKRTHVSGHELFAPDSVIVRKSINGNCVFGEIDPTMPKYQGVDTVVEFSKVNEDKLGIAVTDISIAGDVVTGCVKFLGGLTKDDIDTGKAFIYPRLFINAMADGMNSIAGVVCFDIYSVLPIKMTLFEFNKPINKSGDVYVGGHTAFTPDRSMVIQSNGEGLYGELNPQLSRDSKETDEEFMHRYTTPSKDRAAIVTKNVTITGDVVTGEVTPIGGFTQDDFDSGRYSIAPRMFINNQEGCEADVMTVLTFDIVSNPLIEDVEAREIQVMSGGL